MLDTAHQLLQKLGSKSSTTVVLLSLPLLLLSRTFLRRLGRRHLSKERVLVIGASSGVGKEIALQYTRRGARVCAVGRRADQVDAVSQLCRTFIRPNDEKDTVLGMAADFTVPEDMTRVRDAIHQAWNGLDTVIVSAGVSALRPILALAGIQADVNGASVKLHPSQISTDGIQSALDISHAALKGNFDGPLVVALTFIPLISETSPSPAIQLISTPAAVIPAPTRGLYGSSKSASLILYQALSIEHPNIDFSFILPGTIQGDFRSSAVDNGPVREADPNKRGMKPGYVARKCIQAIENREKLVVFPFLMRLGHWVYWYVSWKLVEWYARKKYRYPR